MVTYNVNLENKTVLVTGAAGFIGSNLVRRLIADVPNIKIVGIDTINNYYDVNLKKERLSDIRKSLITVVDSKTEQDEEEAYTKCSTP